LEASVGVPVKAFYASDYAGVIEAMRFNKAQVAWFGNKSAMEAVDRSQGEVFAQVVGLDGSQGYYSLLITQSDSPYRSLADVLQHSHEIRFGIGDPNSTSGYLVPSYYAFAVNHVDPKTAFKRVLSSNHEGNLLSIAAKQLDVATNNTGSLERFKQTHPEKAVLIKEIWRSVLIPSDPIVYRKDLDPALKTKIAGFFLNYGKTQGVAGERERKVLEALSWSGFIPSDNKQLLPIRQLELFLAKSRVEGDTRLSPEEKAQRLAELDAKQKLLESEINSSTP